MMFGNFVDVWEKFFKTLKCSSGQVECSFDNPAEIFLVKVYFCSELFAQCQIKNMAALLRLLLNIRLESLMKTVGTSVPCNEKIGLCSTQCLYM